MTTNLTIAELLALDEQVAEVMQRHGLGDCLGCVMASFDTLTDAAREYGIDAQCVLREIDAVCAKKGKPKERN